MAINSKKIKYWVGKSMSLALDSAVATGVAPKGLPMGRHLEFDLQRYLDKPVLQIIDGGANVGNAALRFSRYFKEATIHAFEPVGKTFQTLQERTKSNPKIICNHLALGEKEASLTITLSDDSELNSLLNATAAAPAQGTEVIKVVTLDQYMAKCRSQKIDLLKLDLEGYELQALQGAQSLLEKRLIGGVYAECGFARLDANKTSFCKLDYFLTERGLVFSGFYQDFRWGPNKRWLGYTNALWLRF